MDISGAKALKERLAGDGAHDALPVPADANIPEDAPPVYHWTGKTPAEAAAPGAEEDTEPRRASFLSRLSLGFR